MPYTDTSLCAVPDGVTNEQALFLADSLPTGYEVGVLAGGVRPGNTVAVVGSGAVGLSAILTTGLWGASKIIAIDSNKFRLERRTSSARPTPSRSVPTRCPTCWP